MSPLTTSYAYHPITEHHDDACFICFSLEGRRHMGRKPLIRKRYTPSVSGTSYPVRSTPHLYMYHKHLGFLTHPSTLQFFIASISSFKVCPTGRYFAIVIGMVTIAK